MKQTIEQVIIRMNMVHKNKYDYSLFKEYKNKYQKIDIICKDHGLFIQDIGNHLYHKTGCPECGLKIRKKIDDPISKFIEVHGNFYDYSKVEYVSIKKIVNIICKLHGDFFQTPQNHLRGNGCPECGIKKMSESLKKPVVDFIKKCNEIHDELYDYSKVEYNKLSDKIIIICNKHGEFIQRAFSHQQGYGCNKCSKSKGEYRIEKFLSEHNIIFEYNKHFDDCRNKNTLPFDFYLPFYNCCIEYDGIQHYESVYYFGGDDKLKYQKKLDGIKNSWCLKNKIKLIRISYKDFQNIENILFEYLYNNKNI